MPTRQNKAWLRRRAPAVERYGDLKSVTFRCPINADTVGVAVATTDVLELGELPAGAELVSAELITSGLAAGTVTIGFMSGNTLDTIAARTNGTQLFNATAANATADLTTAQVRALAENVRRSTDNRSIGFTSSVNQPLGAAVVELTIQYRA